MKKGKAGGSRERLNMWSPEMISGPPVYFRAAPYVAAGITAAAGRAGGGRGGGQGTHMPTAPEEEEVGGRKSTERAARFPPCPVPFGAVSPAWRLFLGIACFTPRCRCACATKGGCGPAGRLLRAPDSPGGLPVASAGRDSTKPRFSDPLGEGYFIYSTLQLF